MANIERLSRLIMLLKAFPEEQFNMHTWYSTDSCGTVCCAAGAACLDPEFQKAGLTLEPIYSSPTRSQYKEPVYTIEVDSEEHHYACFDALERFFDLPEEDVHFIFDQRRYLDCFVPAQEDDNIFNIVTSGIPPYRRYKSPPISVVIERIEEVITKHLNSDRLQEDDGKSFVII